MRPRRQRTTGRSENDPANPHFHNIADIRRPSHDIALDAEQLIYQVTTFINAASMINRIGKT
jgi:hypothetical protein